MPYYVVSKLQRILNRHGRCLNGANVLVLGVTYKADVGDPRETPAVKVMELLQREGVLLTYVDPFVPHLMLEGRPYESAMLTAERLAGSDCALILTAHSAFDFDLIVRHARVVFDTRNGTKHVQGPKTNVVLL